MRWASSGPTSLHPSVALPTCIARCVTRSTPADTSGMARVRKCAALAVVVVLLTGVVGCGLFRGDDPATVVTQFAAAWSSGDDGRAASLTSDPEAAVGLLTATRASLAAVGLVAEVRQVRSGDDRATASVDVRWDLGGGRTWTYLTEIELRPADTELGWEVVWSPSVVHPLLAPAQSLETTIRAPDPAAVLDRSGRPLLTPGTVVSVLLDRRSAGDLPAVADALARILSRFDQSITSQAILDEATRAPHDQPYQVAVLRETDYRTVQSQLHDLPGVRFTTAQRLLAPDAGFARHVLTGLRTELQHQLAGTAGWSVRITDSSRQVVHTLVEEPPRPGTPVRTTLDFAVQAAAEDAVEPVDHPTVLVALQPSTGGILAVAQNGPADNEGAIALAGRYPPGSTFKIVTAAAAIAAEGLTAATPVGCPATTIINGRRVPNNDYLDLGTVPLADAFARSCNTTFAELGARLGENALPDAALTLGIGADYVVPGIVTITGSVPASANPVERAENAFGQGRVLVSPLGMALAAATIAAGRPVVPQLLFDQPTEVVRPPATPAVDVLDHIRPMMRAVVTRGTARRLSDLGAVHGKTGTAEYVADGSRAHGWFVGYRDDIAFAALVVDGGSSDAAVAVVERFLEALDR